MKKNIRFACFLTSTVLVVALSACGPRQQQNASGSEVSAPVFDDEQLTGAYERYIHLKDALVTSDADKAKSEAAMLHAELGKIAEGENAAALAAGIAGTTDLQAQRTAFSKLSNAMTELVKAAEVTDGEVYLAFCPMAMDDTGAYWLANEQEIRNPYFGDKMMRCGEIKERWMNP
ncbi:uncharacterized protein DUF3347 [Anseongella ginsenosidimutans]|uniref:Uncharacterized protein DUF3347 n=1 Tax=Anseongella ginsenosidimutans TaxID=496056 RepID=A0A4R3KP92_9SPHI|nr:DUF3347 domain-containing protein [Anseongella ginsenosidimutans]QEC52562.1 DUF3347 domain-containing protein [Anseongella ginsenosidimutans]TCS86478.1 uncharacterized protein DUF3347 [Anseongella ginsenosidimutans]